MLALQARAARACSLVRRLAPKKLLKGERREKLAMQDLMFIAITIVFFVVSIAYVEFCDAIK